MIEIRNVALMVVVAFATGVGILTSAAWLITHYL